MHAGQEIHQIRHIEQRVAVGWSMCHDHGSFQMQHVLQRSRGNDKTISFSFFSGRQRSGFVPLCLSKKKFVE